jgi:SH3 domain protein
MSRSFILGLILILLPMTLSAETKYVSEIREISVRTGPGTEYKIIAMIKTGIAMTILEEQEDWSHIRLEDGRDGWVLNRYIQPDAPDTTSSSPPPQSSTAPAAPPGESDASIQELNSKIATLTAEMTRRQNEMNALKTAYDSLKEDSGVFLDLQEKYKAMSAELSAQKERADRAENDFSSLYNKERLKWFVAGAGVLLVGVLLGFITKPQRRRTSLL